MALVAKQKSPGKGLFAGNWVRWILLTMYLISFVHLLTDKQTGCEVTMTLTTLTVLPLYPHSLMKCKHIVVPRDNPCEPQRMDWSCQTPILTL